MLWISDMEWTAQLREKLLELQVKEIESYSWILPR